MNLLYWKITVVYMLILLNRTLDYQDLLSPENRRGKTREGVKHIGPNYIM
jgi:hypothetical protein